MQGGDQENIFALTLNLYSSESYSEENMQKKLTILISVFALVSMLLAASLWRVRVKP